MYFKIKNINMVANFLNALTALFLVLNCQSVWQKSLDKNYHIYEICFILIIIESLYTTFYWNKSKKISLYGIKIILFYIILIILIMILSVDLDNIVKFLSRFLIFPFFMLHFSSQAPIKQKLGIFYWFFNWTAIIAWVTTICWLLSIIGIINETSFMNVDWFGRYSSYYNIYFSSPYQCIDWLQTSVRRNVGIFTEGPMFMFALIISLLFSDILRDYYNIKFWKVTGIILALLSIASITGYIALLFIIGIKLISYFKNIKIQILFGVICFIFILIGIFILLFLKQNTASYIARFDDYIAGIKCWLNSPLYGNGYENIELIKTFMSDNRSWNQGFSNSIFSILSYGGVLFAIPYLVPVFRGMYYGFKKLDYIIFQLSFIFTLLYFTVISYTFYLNFAIWAFLMCKYKKI